MVDGANQTFYSAAKNAKFSVFKTCKMAVAGQNTRRPRQGGQKIIVNQSKPILLIVSIKPFTRQSFRQNYFSREIEWAVFTETASLLTLIVTFYCHVMWVTKKQIN